METTNSSDLICNHLSSPVGEKWGTSKSTGARNLAGVNWGTMVTSGSGTRRCSGAQVFTSTQVLRYTKVHKCMSAQVCIVITHRYTGTQVYRYTGTQIHATQLIS